MTTTTILTQLHDILRDVETAAREGMALIDAPKRSGTVPPALLGLAKLALNHLDGQEYLQACAIIIDAENKGGP